MQGSGSQSNVSSGTSRRADRGFTLIELIVTLSVLAILIALAVPSFTSLINANRLTAQANELVTSLQLGRSEAVRRNIRVVVCRSADGLSCTTATGQGDWITFVDADANNTAVAADVIKVSAIKAPVQVSNAVAAVAFGADGLARTGAGLLAADFTICLPTTNPAANVRTVSVVTGSQISTASSDGGGACPP